MALMFSLHRIDFVSRLWFGYWTGMAGAVMIAGRLATYRVLARVRNAGLNLQQVAVAGCGEHPEVYPSGQWSCQQFTWLRYLGLQRGVARR